MKSVKRPTRNNNNNSTKSGKITRIIYPTQPVKELTLDELTRKSEELDSWWDERKAALDLNSNLLNPH